MFNKIMTFEEYLQEKHADQYEGLDDDMVENFDSWMETLTVEDVLEYGEYYGKRVENIVRKEYEKKVS